LKDLLPKSIAARRSKADFSHPFGRAIERLGGAAVFTNLAVEQLGWIQGPVVRRMADDLVTSFRSGNDRYLSLTWKVWRVLAIELWVRYSSLSTLGKDLQASSGGGFARYGALEDADHVESPR
jgi:hypothetical protein